MARNESSRFVQTLIREESRAPITPSEPTRSATSMPAGAISRLIRAIGGKPNTSETATTLVGRDTQTQVISTVAAPSMESSPPLSGSFEVGDESTTSSQPPLPRPATIAARAPMASLARASSVILPPTPSDQLEGIRSAQRSPSADRLSVSLPLAATAPSPRPTPIRNENPPDRGGGLRFAGGVDEIFDQVWVKVQRRIGNTPHEEDDVQEGGIAHHNIQSIVVTSWAEDEGTSTVALGLAGRAGSSMPGRICLVDADFLERGLTKASSLAGQKGLSDLLAGQASIDDVLVDGQGSPFAFIPAGTLSDPAVLSVDTRLQEVIRSLEDRFRYVFYDVSSLKRGVEAYRWGRFVVNTILVVRAGSTRRQTIRHAVDQIQLHGMDLLGTILNERIDVIPNWLYPYI